MKGKTPRELTEIKKTLIYNSSDHYKQLIELINLISIRKFSIWHTKYLIGD